MKIYREWLQTYFTDPLPETSVLSDALTFHAFEIDGVENDVLDVKVTANRGHDCLSHRGIAKELAAILKQPLKSDPLRQPVTLEPKTDSVRVEIAEPTLCNRYVAAHIKNIQVGPSPAWLRKSLDAIGQRSINSIVDATNYVMFGIGQPLHAFDAGQLTEEDGKYSIRVRKARSGEKIMALDNKEYALSDSMLLIVDSATDAPIGIAGVKGGKPAGVSETTTDIIIESANFESISTRRTAQALKLRTDASARYEQKISPEYAGYGMKAVIELILQLAGGELVGIVDEYPVKQEKREVSVTLSRMNAVLGVSLTAVEVADVLTRLDLAHVQTGETFAVHVPSERLDLEISEDLIEEVGRIIGYDKVPAVELPAFARTVEVNNQFAAAEQVRERLMSEGYSEVFTSVFTDTGERAVANKIGGEKSFLRSTLKESLETAVALNVSNQELLGTNEIKIFEIGTVWKDGAETIKVGKAKGSKKSGSRGGSWSGEGGFEGEEDLTQVHVSAYEDTAASTTVRYQPFSKYPFIVRDVALWVPGEVDEAKIIALLRQGAGDLLARIDRFDRFEKDGRVSYAFRLVFQSFDKTLTDFDANERMESVHAVLKKEGFEIR